MHSRLLKNLDLEFDNKDNITRIIHSSYALSLESQILIDWKFENKEIKTWQIHLSYKEDEDKDFTTKTYYLYFNKKIDPTDKASVLIFMKDLYSKISNKKTSLLKKDIDPTKWIRCEELIFTKNF